MEARARLLDVAAYLDRVQRSGEEADDRHQALRRCLEILSREEGGRARAVLEALSDPSTDPAPDASAGPARGAPPVS